MKCVVLFLVVSFVVAVNSDPNPAVHRVTGHVVRHKHRIPASELERGGGKRHVHRHRIPGKRVHHVHHIKEGGGGGGRHVHRVTGKLETHTHHISGGGRGGGGGGGGPGSISTGGPKGGEANGNTRCRKSGLTGLADKLNVGLQDLVNKIANAGGANPPGKPGLIGHVLGGAQTALDNAIGGLDQGVSDFFCGFNRVFNKIGSQVAEGNVLNAVLSGANVFVSGAGSFFGNLGTNAIGAITSGVSDILHGRRNKKANKIVHSHHGDLTDKV